ncbi:GGDEF domain-containing response regulator [Gynuella sunshinyii]|uniref:Putative signal transduction protein containing a membrane domain, an EAL and a GGDEF domain n=1 Tax=Gynuella sunshinyii YC6258 TaxID=1445510 RepID=A0A0C5VUU5_9GAMM|nr:GGDEF domain-containing response regulator [Gynuella sunshinyii]AJQ97906.1 putative signal transduction protein containing a membrane domain, an EAL and a GGDEF domain [Gynuella sunshinyii YC6258]
MYLRQREGLSDIFLMAEDNPADAELVTEMLRQAFDSRYTIVCVDCFSKVMEALADGTFQALILDMNLPDQSGIDNIAQLGAYYPNLPIVILTGQDDLNSAIDALQSGAQDYLSKNHVTPEILARSLRYAQERKYIEQQLKKALDDAAYRNIQLETQAKYDPLTRLPNRTYFHDAANRVLHRAMRLVKQVALLYFDLNGFKKVNDAYGHLIGDKLLQQISIRLTDVVRENDFLARLGGDEFVVITDVLDSKQEIYPLVKRIQGQFDHVFEIDAHQIVIRPAIGVAFFPEADSLDLLIKQADSAMYEAKEDVINPVCFYTDQLAAQFARTQKIEVELGRALTRGELTSRFQPVIDTAQTDRILVEALMRWYSPKLGWISPNEFIPVAEFTPAINEITRQAVKDAAGFYNALIHLQDKIDKIAINVCASQLSSRYFCRLFLQWLEEFALPKDKICLELTERQIVENADTCRDQITLLQQHGIQIALDDFGSGYSSITHLLDLPLNILKLDRKLLDRIDQNERNQALTAGIIEMASRLNMKVVAEGIERPEEYKVAVELGCHYLQGFGIAKPLSIDEVAVFYHRAQSD